ncbi:hypothetical protein RS3R6_53970 [Pseudomonas atacamensis]|uniref:Uncharacterized protein n=1 Tax=Pseudomonas atacamensis TaxID=2565368 RepID=A0ABQ5PHD7_9PSED|nr:hypothetical protein RS3R1_19130 [Pseudomonas atacamensis]GLH57214.1 hypothetical protein RS3R6_53970 [Pseudomonas atacamensis]
MGLFEYKNPNVHKIQMWEQAARSHRYGVHMIVPTLCVGMQPGTLCVPQDRSLRQFLQRLCKM